MTPHNRTIIEKAIVRYLIEKAHQHGWSVVAVNDGEETHKIDRDAESPVKVADQVVDIVFSVEESHIRFAKVVGQIGERTIRRVFVVLGNGAHECLADHSCSVPDLLHDNFEDMMNEVYEFCSYFEGLK